MGETKLDWIRRRMDAFYNLMREIITPGLRNSQFAYKEKLQSYLKSGHRWLEVGCGQQLLPAWMPHAATIERQIISSCRHIVGVDPDFNSLSQHAGIRDKVCAFVNQLPFSNDCFDLVTANMVLEHIADPESTVREIARVCKPGGIFIFHTPNAHGYSTLVTSLIPDPLIPRLSHFLLGRQPADVYPTHYRLNTRAAIAGAAARQGLEIVEYISCESSAQARMLGPIVILELLLIRLLRWPRLVNFRTNIIVVLQKPLDRIP